MATPFYDPNGVLINMKGGVWTLADALAGILTTGGTGSGKSSAIAVLLLTTFLTSTATLPNGMGGIMFFAKNGEVKQIINACKQAGRSKDIICFGPYSPHGFNMMAWLAGMSQGGDRGPLVLVDFFLEIGTAVDPASAGGGDDSPFFASAHRTQLLNLCLLAQLARLPVSLPLMRAIAISSPRTLGEANDPTWQRTSVCAQTLREAEVATRSDPAAAADFVECRRYFTVDYPALSDRTRGVIDTMLTSLIQPFLTRPLRTLFCEHTTVTPEACCDGKILLIDIPVQEYGVVGKLAALVWKRAFQLMVMRRSGPPGSLRPVFLFADEAQNFLSPKDSEYQAVARGAGGVTCFLTQQRSSIRDAMGTEDKAENLTANLQTKIFCQNTGETNEWASHLIGERYVNITSINVGRGSGAQEGVPGATSHAGISRHDEKRAWIEPSAFQKLRRGGAPNNFLVDAVVFVGGKLFAGEDGPQPFKLLSFRQQR